MKDLLGIPEGKSRRHPNRFFFFAYCAQKTVGGVHPVNLVFMKFFMVSESGKLKGVNVSKVMKT